MSHTMLRKCIVKVSVLGYFPLFNKGVSKESLFKYIIGVQRKLDNIIVISHSNK